MKKGISPLLTSVLLIALVIAVASIYTGWFTNFIREITSTVGSHSEKKVECSYGGIALDNLEYNSTSGYLTGNIENTNMISLGNIDLEIFYDNATKEKKDLNKSLGPGEMDIFNEMINTNYERVRVITNCSEVYDEVSSGSISTVI
jgi:flagellin-like protein